MTDASAVPNRLTRLLTAALALLITTPLIAQEDGAASDDSEKSFFQAFFLSDDPIGLGITWLLIVMSMASIGFAIHLLIKYRRSAVLPLETIDELDALIGEKQYREAIDLADDDPTYIGQLASGALAEASNGYGAMERAIEEVGDAETTKMLRPIEYLNVLGNISPMIGLFGTVYGMILAFQQLVASGGSPDPAELAAGISTALVTTFWGLVVAIPALTCYALIRNRVDALTTEGLLLAEDIIRPFKPGKKGAPTKSAKATPQPD
ncbi:MAG: MotA/TolQ/ExbB proton channel family protein [Planctomycetota bacterium]